MATVTLEGVSKYFGTVPAVQDLSCTIAQGEFLALLGPSGCGKTTTLLMLTGIYRNQLYHAPANEFVARFIGSAPMNLLPMQLVGHAPMLRLVDTALCFALPAATRAIIKHGLQSTTRYTLGLRPEHILLQSSPGEHLLPAAITLLEPLGREVLLSVTCGPHLLKVLVPAPCALTPDIPVWLNLSQGLHHFFDPHTGVALV
jgi:ABC-type sugar transport system ATPase subunit